MVVVFEGGLYQAVAMVGRGTSEINNRYSTIVNRFEGETPPPSQSSLVPSKSERWLM